MSDSSIPSDEELASFLGDVTEPASFGIQDEAFGEITFSPGDPNEPIPENIEEGGAFEGATITIGDGQCKVCGEPTFRPPGLTATGRKKRVPSYCDLHNPKRKVVKEDPFAGKGESQLARIQEELADDLRLLGMLAGPVLPVTGYYVLEHADAFTTALLKLSKNNQNVLRVLHRVAQVAPIYTVAETVAGTAYAVQVDMQKADPHNVAAQRLGVSRAYDNVYPEEVNNVASNGRQGPPRYATTQ